MIKQCQKQSNKMERTTKESMCVISLNGENHVIASLTELETKRRVHFGLSLPNYQETGKAFVGVLKRGETLIEFNNRC